MCHWLMYFGKTVDTHNHLRTKIHIFRYRGIHSLAKEIPPHFHLAFCAPAMPNGLSFPKCPVSFHASVSLHILFPVPGLPISLSLVKLVLVLILPPNFGVVLLRLWHLLLRGAALLLNVYFHCYTSVPVSLYVCVFSNSEVSESRNEISWILLFPVLGIKTLK